MYCNSSRSSSLKKEKQLTIKIKNKIILWSGPFEVSSMAKKAVLIGINYPGTKAELRGCVNDVKRMHKCLVDRFGFSERNITELIDTDNSSTKPTGKNIRRALLNLVESARSGDVLVVHYSGHGTRLPAETGEDDDTGYDECIVPCDMNLITGKWQN